MNALTGWLAFKRFLRPPRPHNSRRRSVDTIDADVAYSLQIAHADIEIVRSYAGSIARPRVLEIGPGSDFGAQIILAGTGADVAVADLYLAGWQPNYHPAFYRRLREAWGKPCAPLDAVIEASDPAAAIRLIAEPAENLSSCTDNSFDIVISNAVLEHVYDLPTVFAEARRITASGGINSHQIDFRDHDNFDRPLEFLLMSEKAHATKFACNFGCIGNRWRHCEVAAMCIDAGFFTKDATPSLFAEPSYMAHFLPRLRRGAPSRFAGMSDNELAILGARFLLQKPL